MWVPAEAKNRSRNIVMTSASTRSTPRVLAMSALAGAIGVFLPAAAAHAQTKPTVPSAAETHAPAPTTAAPNTTTTEASVPGTTTIAPTNGDTSIRPFAKIHMPQEAIQELRRRIAATRWPEKETVADQSQGVPLATMQEPRALLGDRLRLAKGGSEAERLSRNSSPTSTGSTFTSSTSGRGTKTRFR